MCVVSMIYDHYYDKWRQPLTWPPPTISPGPQPTPEELQRIMYPPKPPVITAEEIAEFRKLLERAREYDRKHNQPDCELEEKRMKIRELATTLGVEIDFL